MKLNKITLKVIQGDLSAKEFSFHERTICVIGRALDSHILLPDNEAHSTISRYHCLLDINPPDICVRDFGSLNGTYVNGTKIGQRTIDENIIHAQEMIYPEYDLQNGDKIKLGETILLVSKDNDELFSDEQAPDKQAPDSRVVPKKNQKQADAHFSLSQIDPLDQINVLLRQADQGNEELISIKGYSIEKELGKGSMGVVYLASHNKTQAQVALKVMLPKVEAEPQVHRQFIRETKNTTLLKHKNIVGVQDIGCYDETFFFTTEYCEAGSVAQLIKQQGGKLPLFLALKILFQVLDGLQFAHTVKIPTIVLANGKQTSGVGLVHRDIKPGNLLLTHVNGALQVKIADFGLAKAFDTAGLSGRTATGVSAGTPYFMPRQQVINFKFSKPEVDVWAASATFYKMVTGRYPRRYTKEVDPWLTTLKTTATPIRESEPSIPRALAEVIDKALIDKSEMFYKSAAELKDDLLKVI